ncbi:golgin subfamily A member 4 isoform X1 [Daktulosphaira vitifoliae]|uniref:golgin subfamily A member 4 isoform X1 n=1 Tax=Daktulosphaira vitifoliae TaxID=58002 RepID=UPI0021AA5905|nr:golgin subfamily A member 4 isoform X1 [Daktulosphaira vitifoliae]
MPKFETFHSFLLKNKIYLIKMFKKLKVTIGKNEESKLKPKTGNQESSSWSGFSSVSPNINDSQFCIDDETDDTSKDSPARVAVSESTTVDLNKFNQSSSSLVIDNHSSFHTDLESASEFDDNVSVVSEYANDITKENLYAAYKKLFGRYYKNKNKYLELNSKFKQMLLTHDKDKITMTKAQDKLLQRIVELKEQCTLEQAAKAHMEEALRNDIEERDHIISTLNTKIDLLKKKDENDESDTSLSDVIELQEKCKKLNNELISSRSECDLLQKQIETLKKSEENTLLTLAENKKEIHKELELKEDQIKKLEKIINGLQMENKILSKEKSIENIITEVYKYNEKLEKKKHELIELQKEFDDFKKNEQIAVKSDMVNTLHDLQEKLNAQIKTISDLKNEHENYKAVEKKKWTDKLVETENKWVEKMDNYKKMMDTSHREEIDALTGEWNNERKHQAELNISEKKHDEDLEKIVLNVETSSQREEVLQRQVNKLNKELSEIKKMFRNEFHNKSNTNEEDENIEKSYVEMEFLRNILYEYMMGKQPMVLAKVLAAIVKFDTEQLKSVLQKEEQKVSLLKTLGLS